MIHLVVKDFYVNRKYILLISLYLGFVLYFMGASDSYILFVMGIISYGTVTRSCYNDDKDRGGIFLKTLPIKASTIVFSKYFLGFVILLFTIILIMLFAIFSGDSPESYYGSIAGAIFTMSLVYAVYLPVFFKLGYMKAITFQTIFFIGIMALSFGIRSFANIAEHSNVINQEQWLIAILVNFIKMISKNTTTLIIIASIISLMMLTISIILSLKFYDKSA